MRFVFFVLGILLGAVLTLHGERADIEDDWYCIQYDHRGNCVVQQRRDYARPPASAEHD